MPCIVHYKKVNKLLITGSIQAPKENSTYIFVIYARIYTLKHPWKQSGMPEPAVFKIK